jgi:hypothetical protein
MTALVGLEKQQVISFDLKLNIKKMLSLVSDLHFITKHLKLLWEKSSCRKVSSINCLFLNPLILRKVLINNIFNNLVFVGDVFSCHSKTLNS